MTARVTRLVLFLPMRFSRIAPNFYLDRIVGGEELHDGGEIAYESLSAS
jgi:hypothetical protein